MFCRQGQTSQPQSAEPEEAVESEHHVEKARRKEELSPWLTPQGRALLEASRAVTRAITPTAPSMRKAFSQALSFK